MKKALFIAVLLVAGAGVAFSSSLGLPWYVDNAPANQFPVTAGIMGLVFLHNNTDNTVNPGGITASVTYFSQDGAQLAPTGSTTFNISPNASIAFRPVADDPDGSVPVVGQLGGQEGGLHLRRIRLLLQALGVEGDLEVAKVGPSGLQIPLGVLRRQLDVRVAESQQNGVGGDMSAGQQETLLDASRRTCGHGADLLGHQRAGPAPLEQELAALHLVDPQRRDID